ncbi:HWE histidine kinase domain-containing protein [Sphingomonas sp. dw_22]|uniref:HWE histidine kinase domain-containing protein n=1 Tax=Sphingomonas sp. dw_22 TaxID=2721175 RepID=UPI00211637FD|nr:HWE histidine kinase domain-containing protein [Sphingomonas sp. dw_22]
MSSAIVIGQSKEMIILTNTMKNIGLDGQESAESEVDDFRKNLGPFVVAAQTTQMPIAFTNARCAGNRIIFANDSFLELTGYDREEMLGRSLDDLVDESLDAPTISGVGQEFGGRHGDTLDIHYNRKDGSGFWASTFVSPVCDEAGNVIQYFVSFVDLTRHRQEQAHLRMLIDELNHRVKNTLATVQSIVSQALRAPLDPEYLREAIESRIFALSRSHELLTLARWRDAGLHDLLDAALEPFGAASGWSERFSIDGDNIRVPPNMALALGIAFHELATNAVKYGALSTETGLVEITWSLWPSADETRLVLVWKESNGPLVAVPSTKGFGSEVIERGLAHELRAKVALEFAPGGAICTIDMPTPKGSQDG